MFHVLFRYQSELCLSPASFIHSNIQLLFKLKKKHCYHSNRRIFNIYWLKHTKMVVVVLLTRKPIKFVNGFQLMRKIRKGIQKYKQYWELNIYMKCKIWIPRHMCTTVGNTESHNLTSDRLRLVKWGVNSNSQSFVVSPAALFQII